jgi:hypothetical protein
MKSTIICDVTPCSLLEFYRCSGGTYCLLLQGQRVTKANSKENDSRVGNAVQKKPEKGPQRDYQVRARGREIVERAMKGASHPRYSS